MRGGALSTEPPAISGTDSYDYRASCGLTTGRRGLGSTTPFAMAIDQRLDDAYSVLYTTGPLTAPMMLLGAPEAVLHVSSSAETAYFHVRLCDVSSDGGSALIADGGLLASHRESHELPQPITPGEIYELRIPLRHTAYELAPGHRLRVAISSAEFQNAWPTPFSARNSSPLRSGECFADAAAGSVGGPPGSARPVPSPAGDTGADAAGVRTDAGSGERRGDLPAGERCEPVRLHGVQSDPSPGGDRICPIATWRHTPR